MRPEGFVMLMLITLGFAGANLVLLCRIWRGDRRRRNAVRDQLNRLSASGRGRPGRRRSRISSENDHDC
jgi:hypothetical protein